jgi:hypothetical protein
MLDTCLTWTFWVWYGSVQLRYILLNLHLYWKGSVRDRVKMDNEWEFKCHGTIPVSSTASPLGNPSLEIAVSSHTHPVLTLATNRRCDTPSGLSLHFATLSVALAFRSSTELSDYENVNNYRHRCCEKESVYGWHPRPFFRK